MKRFALYLHEVFPEANLIVLFLVRECFERGTDN